MLQVKGAGTVLRPAARPRPCCRPRSEGRTRVVVSHAWTREPVPYTTTSGNVVTAGLTRDGPCPSGDLLAVPDDGVYQYLAVPGTAAPALWVALGDDIVAAAEEKPEAVLPALTDLRALGVTGVSIDLHWAVFEPSPRQYNWDAYRPVFSLIRRAGLQLQANFCFHADPGGGAWTGGGGGGSGGSHRGSQLPSWVLAVGDADPEVYFADKEGNRCRECLSLGIDDVPVLAGRTPVQCHAHAVASLLASDPRLPRGAGGPLTDARLSLGPGGELRYPSHLPRGSGGSGGSKSSSGGPLRWAPAPGVGEFQCYDAWCRAALRAAAARAGRPQWGADGGWPPDAGGDRLCASQQAGSLTPLEGGWRSSDYGRFFGSWYAGMLVAHLDRVLGATAGPLNARGVRPRVALPLVPWFAATAARLAELTAGYCAPPGSDGDAYLPALSVLARHGAAADLSGGDLSDSGQPRAALAAPEALLLQQRGVAAALGVPVSISNAAAPPGARALAALARRAAAGGCYRGVDAPPAPRVVVAGLGEGLLTGAGAWALFREWAAARRGAGGARCGGGAPSWRSAAQGGGTQQQQQQQQQVDSADLWPAGAEALASS